MDDEAGGEPFNFDRFVEAQQNSFIREFGWPDEYDEPATEEGDGD